MFRFEQKDCFAEDALSTIAPKSVKLVIADLPYGITSRNEWDQKIDLKKLFAQFDRACCDDAIVVMFAQGMFSAELMTGPWHNAYRYSLVWEKNKPRGFLNAKKQPLRYHEDILVFYKKPGTYNPQMVETGRPSHACKRARTGTCYGDAQGGENTRAGRTDRYPSSILKFNVINAEEKPFHPTQKPLPLAEYLIKTYSSAGDTVLDPCAGSCVVGKACKTLGRNFIGFEKNLDLFTAAVAYVDAAPTTVSK